MSNTTPECPRCGYDRSGEIETWRERCPLEGRCSECGFDVDWGELFNPDCEIVAGFYDHARGMRRRLGWAWRSAARIARPPKFWRWAPLAIHGGWARSVSWLLAGLVPAWLIAQVVMLIQAIVISSVAHARWRSGQSLTTIARWELERLAASPVYSKRTVYWPVSNDPWHVLRDWPVCVVAGLVFTFGVTLTLLVSPVTLGRASVKASHVTRAAIFSLAWLFALAVFRLGERIVQAGQVFVRWPILRGSSPRFEFVEWLETLWPLSTLVILAWQAWWWLETIQHGWRLESPRSIWFAGVVIGALMTTGVLMLHRTVLFSVV